MGFKPLLLRRQSSCLPGLGVPWDPNERVHRSFHDMISSWPDLIGCGRKSDTKRPLRRNSLRRRNFVAARTKAFCASIGCMGKRLVCPLLTCSSVTQRRTEFPGSFRSGNMRRKPGVSPMQKRQVFLRARAARKSAAPPRNHCCIAEANAVIQAEFRKSGTMNSNSAGLCGRSTRQPECPVAAV